MWIRSPQRDGLWVPFYCLAAKSCVTLLRSATDVAHQTSTHGISQASILGWVDTFFFRGSSWPRDRTHLSSIGRWILYHWATWETPSLPTKPLSYTSWISPFLLSVQFSSVAQLCPTLCNPMKCSTPGLPVRHQLPSSLRLTSIESVMPSSHLIPCRPLLLLPPIPPSISFFPVSHN